jgi:maltose O-acetyltransferase
MRYFAYHLLLYIANYWIASIPSHHFRLMFYRHLMGFGIADDASILMGAQFDAKGNFSLGRASTINRNCRLDTRGGISIGDNVIVADDVSILTADHDIRNGWGGRQRPVSIADFVFLGTGCMILPGVNIGRGAVVGAGAIVTKDVPEWTIVAGNPARPIGTRTVFTAYTTRYRRLFH